MNIIPHHPPLFSKGSSVELKLKVVLPNEGFAENTGWINEDDGLLVRDVNGNGQIDDGTELFGDNTVLSNGAKADNGFEALKDLDSNIDGVFDANDAAWSEVKVWRDLDSDAKLSIINF